MTLDEFKSMLENHDWFFTYSDDHRYYTKGRDERNAIYDAFDFLTKQGLKQEARELYNDISPDEFYMK